MGKGPQIGLPSVPWSVGALVGRSLTRDPRVLKILLALGLAGVGIACLKEYWDRYGSDKGGSDSSGSDSGGSGSGGSGSSGFDSSDSDKIPVSTDNEPTENTRNIIVTGRTGGGKSTLANVLLGREEFVEVSGSTSGTKEMQSKEFEWNGNRYRVIDTVGFEDSVELLMGEITSIINKVCKNLKVDDQLFFVYKDRFTRAQIEAFEYFKGKICSSYLTIICTNFPEFEDEGKCDEDTRKLKANENIAKVIKDCETIHVDNPPLLYGDMAIKRRESSRQKLLEHLEPNVRK